MKCGVIGLGDMGSGLAKNLIAAGFETHGFDIDPKRLEAFGALGGQVATTVGEVGAACDAVFVMVMNDDQARHVILGDDGLVARMAAGGAILLTATINPHAATAIGAEMAESGLHLIDTPVSGGFPARRMGHSP
jgi:3-hydroxyisobutyrate dehydrogenase-like beta-hydroxyacid dehydrogenase